MITWHFMNTELIISYTYKHRHEVNEYIICCVSIKKATHTCQVSHAFIHKLLLILSPRGRFYRIHALASELTPVDISVQASDSENLILVSYFNFIIKCHDFSDAFLKTLKYEKGGGGVERVGEQGRGEPQVEAEETHYLCNEQALSFLLCLGGDGGAQVAALSSQDGRLRRKAPGQAR